MSAYLLPLKEVARLLSLSEQRIYQLDKELRPTIVQRGQKMVTRWYDPAVVEAYRASRATPNTPTTLNDPDSIAREIAAARLTEYAQAAPFFMGVPAEMTERVRAAILKIVKRLAKEST